MKFILKLIFGLLITILLVVGIPLAIVYFTIADSVDDSPTSLYSEEVTLSSELSSFFNQGFDLEGKDSLDLTLSEDGLNKLIFAFIREKLNSQFMPTSTCKADGCGNIKVLEINYDPIHAKVKLKNIYAKIENNQLGIYLPMTILGVKTRAKIVAKFIENEDYFIIDFETLGLGKANLLSGIASKIMLEVLKQTQLTETGINNYFESAGLPMTFNVKDFSIKINKNEMNQLVDKLINADDMDESTEKEMISELVYALTSKNNDLVDFGVFDKNFGLRFDLKKLQVDESLVTLDSSTTQFNKTQFITNKVQNFIISNLVSSNQSKVVFTNNEFNQILYDQSQGYNDFKITMDLPNTDAKIDLKIIGILIDFNATNVVIRINVDINGLKSSLKVTGILAVNNYSEITITINNQITIGEDIDEEVGEYITANSGLILNLLGDNIGDLGIMTYAKTLKSFIISADSFKQLMAVNGTNETPLNVSRLKIVDDAIEVYVNIESSNPLANTIATVTETINNVLATNTFTADDFDIDDPVEAEVVNELLANLDAIAEGIINNELDASTTNALIDSINTLSPENQAVLLAGIENNANSSELISLYDSLFGNN